MHQLVLIGYNLLEPMYHGEIMKRRFLHQIAIFTLPSRKCRFVSGCYDCFISMILRLYSVSFFSAHFEATKLGKLTFSLIPMQILINSWAATKCTYRNGFVHFCFISSCFLSTTMLITWCLGWSGFTLFLWRVPANTNHYFNLINLHFSLTSKSNRILFLLLLSLEERLKTYRCKI